MSYRGDCVLCGHSPACGYAWVYNKDEAKEQWLCHNDKHSCYHLWTVYDKRPVGVEAEDAIHTAMPDTTEGTDTGVRSRRYREIEELARHRQEGYDGQVLRDGQRPEL